MADDLNALLSANRSASVLEGIANPAQVNPLAAFNSAATAAGNVYDLRAKQAQQAIGDLLQQSTDENGNVDYPKFHRLAAQAGPVVQMGMIGALKDTSNLRSQQISNTAGHMALLGTASMTVANNPSDANVHAVFDNLAANGMPKDGVERERARWLAMSEDERRQNAYRVGLTNLTGLQRVLGQTTMTNIGGENVATTVMQPSPGQPGGSVVQGRGSVATTLSPEAALAMGIVYPATQADVDAGRATEIGADVRMSGPKVLEMFQLGRLLPPNARLATPPGGGGGGGGGGVVTPDGKPVGPTNPPRLLVVPNALPVPPIPPAAPPAPTGAAVAPAVPAAPVVTPPAPAPPVVAPAPAVAPPPPLPPNAPRADLGGGVPVASANPLAAPALGPASPPSPLVPGDVAAIMRGMDRARGVSTSGPQVAEAGSFSTGPGAESGVMNKAAADRLAADTQRSSTFQATQFPFVQALKNYGEGTVTGPSTEFWNSVGGYIRTPLAKIGINIGPLDDNTQRVDGLRKWLANIQSSNPVSAKSDAMLAQTLHGSASTTINETTGADMVKAGLALERMGVVLNRQWLAMSPQDKAQYGGNYLRYLADANNRPDPRAFGVDLFNPHQMARLRESLKAGGEDNARLFEESLALARRNGAIGGAGSQAMP
jgi:hypothetical protein